MFSGDGCQGRDGGKGIGGGVCRLGLYWEGSGQGRWSIGWGKECWLGSRGRKKGAGADRCWIDERLE